MQWRLKNGFCIIITPHLINLPLQLKLSFSTEKNFLVKIGIGDHLVLGPFTERAPRLLVVQHQFFHELDFVSPQTSLTARVIH